MKAIFEFPGIVPELDDNGLNEIFTLGPSKSYGYGVYKDIYEVLPGSYMRFNKRGGNGVTYWKLVSHRHEDSYEDTVAHVKELVTDSVKRQMVSDVPIATFLSGGLDSSIVTAICSKELEKEGETLNTFSFDFSNNQKNFVANDFQPDRDRPFVDIMIKQCNSNHKYLECNSKKQLEFLYKSVESRDLPTMAGSGLSME